MKYRLGLDLGVGSIGSAVVELDEDNKVKDIIDSGVRIFEVSEGAEERRINRTMRKNLARTRKRLELLAKKLYENNLWVSESPDGTDRLKAKSPYKIRRDALYGKLDNANYIGRALLHIAKHRGAGFVSAAEEMKEEILDEGESSKAKKSSYDKMMDHLKANNSRTLGEFFYKKIVEGKGDEKIVRQKEYAIKKHIVDYAIPRYLVKDEFGQIWDKQAEFFPQMNKVGLKQEVYDILFYERPAAPYAIGKCIYFLNEDRLAKANPLSEMRRIYEEVNNIRIMTDLDCKRLTMEQRDKIVNELLLRGKNAGKKSIKALLGLSGQQKISLYDDRIIEAYLYAKPEFADIPYIKNLSETEFEDFMDFLANPVNPDDKNGRLYNEDELIKKLKIKLDVNDEKEIGKLLAKLPKGRGALGKTATKIILEELKKGVEAHREITDRLSKNDPRFMAEEEVARQSQGSENELPYYGKVLISDTQPLPPLVIQNNPKLNADEAKYGKIANPAVHMILNQIRLVVNEIIKIYGKPYDINLELGRDVGMSSKKKKQFENAQKNNERLNNEAVKHLKEIAKMPVTGKNILKYKLAKEQGWEDAYNPPKEQSRNIPNNFAGFEIEHIIPQAKGGTDTYNNLCLVNRSDNLAKGDMYAYEYFEATKTPEEIGLIMKNARERLKNKSWRFEADAREKFEEAGDEEEKNRYMTDTRYVSKMAGRYLRAIVDSSDFDDIIHNRILPVRGQQTAKLRQQWWLDGLEYELMGLDIPRYIECSPCWVEEDTGEIIEGTVKPDIDGKWHFKNKKKNPEWKCKPRIDHRHHAMDAITVACVNRSLIQKMAKETDLTKIDYPLPLTSVVSVSDFREKVKDSLTKIKVSHKPDHAKEGELHKATVRKIVCQDPERKGALITVYARKILEVLKNVKDLNKLLVSNAIKDEWHTNIAKDRVKQQKLYDDFNAYIGQTKSALIAENEQNVADGKKEIPITEARILLRAFAIIQEKGLWRGAKFNYYESNTSMIHIPKHGVVYESGNNHRVDFYHKDGKVGWEVIKRFDANQVDFVPQWEKDGGKIIWSVQQGDLLELDTPKEWVGYTDKPRCIAKVKKFCEGRVTIDYMSDARRTSPEDKGLKYMLVNSLDKRLSGYTKSHTRKIELTPFGKVKKKHKVLWYGKKAEA